MTGERLLATEQDREGKTGSGASPRLPPHVSYALFTYLSFPITESAAFTPGLRTVYAT